MTTRRIYSNLTIDTATAAAMQKLRTATNYMQNPRCGTGTTSWAANAGTGGAGGLTRVATGGPSDAPTFGRLTLTTAPTGGTMYVRAGSSTVSPVSASTAYRIRARVRASRAGKAYITLGYYGGAGFISSASSAKATLSAGGWLDIPDMLVTTPALTTYVQIQVQFDVSDFSGIASGDTFDLTAMAVYAASDLPNSLVPIYGDGDTQGWSWSGAAHASTSSGPVGVS